MKSVEKQRTSEAGVKRGKGAVEKEEVNAGIKNEQPRICPWITLGDIR